MENLLKILNLLEKRKNKSQARYFIPETWNYFGYKKYVKTPERPGEIEVCPYDFFLSCIKSQVLSVKGMTARTKDDTVKKKQGSDEYLCENIMYGMFPRAFTAWTHDRDKNIYSGTFLKSLSLLPLLKNWGINIIYLLPIFEYSEKYKKGEIGSPYAIKNHYKLDKNLHDPLLGEGLEILETEFKAFVEACHLLKIKVMVDFVFRTVARDNDLMLKHPDWFYWIDIQHNANFSVPKVTKEKKLTHVQEKTLNSLYTTEGIREHLLKFTYPPNKIDFKKWEKVKEKYLQTGGNILDLIEEFFGITTVPGFSNMLNDPQPPWLDVTYLKFYFDLHEEASDCLKENRGPFLEDAFHGYAPFILQDGACLNLYRGKEINQELWEYISGVIPYYQEVFAIDGARIDMGHALPPTLNENIIERVKAVNPDFILWSEEFQPENSLMAKENGFHFIIGSLWYLYKQFNKPGFVKNLINHTMSSALPVTGALETPDTPRIAHVFQDRRGIEFLVLLNYFMPNAVPFINNGMELLEQQPMNLGLDNTEAGRLVLEPDDPMYGKLAFFDKYYFHWVNEEFEWMRALLIKAAQLRSSFIKFIRDKDNFKTKHSKEKKKKLIFLCYSSEESKEYLIFMANKDLRNPVKLKWKTILPKDLRQTKTILIAYAAGKIVNEKWQVDEVRNLGPGEVVIGLIQNLS